jgi:hypothetical protein
VKSLGLALGLGVAGSPVLLPGAQQREHVSNALRPPVNRLV